MKRLTALLIGGMLTAGPAHGQTPAADGPLILEPEGPGKGSAAFWLETSLHRIYPGTAPSPRRTIDLDAGRNYQVSFQAAVRNDRPQPLTVRCSVRESATATGTGPGGLQIRIRRVGYVPQRHHTPATDPAELDGVGHIPGLVPDPLYPEDATTLGPWETQSFWITVRIPAEAAPGDRDLGVRIEVPGGASKAELTAKLRVHPLVVKPRKDFPVTQWWRAETIYDHYRIEAFGEDWWKHARAQLEDLRDHGVDVMGFVPLWCPRREALKRPPQLLKVTRTGDGEYAFDFEAVRRFVRMAKEVGFERFEWPHLWIYWGVRHAMPIYEFKEDGRAELLWPIDTDGHGPVYRGFLAQFLPRFHEFLVSEGILEMSYFHLSDEPPLESLGRYRQARATLRELAPWMKVLDALSDVEFGKEGLTDWPCPIISSAPAYLRAGIPHWVYFCCAPTGNHLNRFFDTPLAKIRMSGFLFHRLKANGFLHWGYNCWQKLETDEMLDPFADGAAGTWPGIPYGDPFVVYPGKDGPIDSIRWEVFAEALQDVALLQTAGIPPDDPMLAPIKDYADFPKDGVWLEEALRKVFALPPGDH